jgi:dUTPase
VSIFAGEKVSIDTGVRVRLPWGCCGRLLLRSGAFRKHRLLLQEGLIGESNSVSPRRRDRGS